MPVQRFARPLLEDGAARTGETTHLAVLQGADVLYVDKEQPPGEAPQLVTEVGVRLPAHLTAVGRAILAQLPAAQVRANLGPSPLVTRTDHGPRSVDELVVAERELPGPAPDEATIRVEWAGICGSDLHVMRTGAWVEQWPATLGHEVVGRVEAAGPAVSVEPGARVVLDSRLPCMSCPAC